jgi:K+-sensing histidine kinase KdpD
LRETDITRLFESLTSDFRVFMRKKGRDNVVLIQEDNLPDRLMLKLDAARTTRIISNLFRNALDNTFSGFIKVGCTYSDEKTTFYVKDSGQGYPRSSDLLLSDNPEIQHSESQDTYSAMNLILARNLILAMDGSIRVEPNEAGGTSVFVSLPVKESPGLKILTGSSSENKIAI